MKRYRVIVKSIIYPCDIITFMGDTKIISALPNLEDALCDIVVKSNELPRLGKGVIGEVMEIES